MCKNEIWWHHLIPNFFFKWQKKRYHLNYILALTWSAKLFFLLFKSKLQDPTKGKAVSALFNTFYMFIAEKRLAGCYIIFQSKRSLWDFGRKHIRLQAAVQIKPKWCQGKQMNATWKFGCKCFLRACFMFGLL